MNTQDRRPSIYQIEVGGHLKEAWSNWFNGMVIGIQKLDEVPRKTTITVHVPDQAALRGVLNKLWDLNLILLSVILID